MQSFQAIAERKNLERPTAEVLNHMKHDTFAYGWRAVQVRVPLVLQDAAQELPLLARLARQAHRITERGSCPVVARSGSGLRAG
eukprot:10963384-Lingulodinium_polyedra.AAC.1